MALVCLSICMSATISCLSVSPEPFERFSLNFGQIFASVRQCAEPITHHANKVKVTIKGPKFEPWISCPLHISLTCGFSLNFGQMFSSVGHCAEAITQPCQLMVKVTVESQVWALNFVSAPYLLYPWKIFVTLWSYVCLSEPLCRTHLLNHANSRSRAQLKVVIKPWISCPLYISFTPGRIFIKLWLNVRLSEMMCRTHDSTWWLKVKVTIKGHKFELLISCWLHIASPKEGYP